MGPTFSSENWIYYLRWYSLINLVGKKVVKSQNNKG